MKKNIVVMLCALICLPFWASAQVGRYPSTAQLAKDLVGVSLEEGLGGKNYHYEGWRWRVEEGEVSNLRVVAENKNSVSE